MTLNSLLPALAALAAVLGCILLSGRLAQMTRLGRLPQGKSGRLALVDTLSLDPRRKLVLVRCDGRCVLVLTGQQDQVLGWLPEMAQ